MTKKHITLVQTCTEQILNVLFAHSFIGSLTCNIKRIFVIILHLVQSPTRLPPLSRPRVYAPEKLRFHMKGVVVAILTTYIKSRFYESSNPHCWAMNWSQFLLSAGRRSIPMFQAQFVWSKWSGLMRDTPRCSKLHPASPTYCWAIIWSVGE